MLDCLIGQKIASLLYGCHYTIYLNHQPLKYILNKFKPIPVMSSSRV